MTTAHAHQHHATHGEAHHGGGSGLNAMAASATLHCLTGCAIGEILGLVLGTALGLGTLATVALAVSLAFLFGYGLSTLPLLRAGLQVGTALTVVLAADTLSIAVMEVVDNAVMIAVPGAMEAGLADPVFWLAMAGALATAFLAAYPVNRALLARGKGHALTHGYHAASAPQGWRRRIPVLGSTTLAAGIAAFLLGGLTAALSVDPGGSEPAGEDPHGADRPAHSGP